MNEKHSGKQISKMPVTNTLPRYNYDSPEASYLLQSIVLGTRNFDLQTQVNGVCCLY
jgi:hypothetical protein